MLTRMTFSASLFPINFAFFSNGRVLPGIGTEPEWRFIFLISSACACGRRGERVVSPYLTALVSHNSHSRLSPHGEPNVHPGRCYLEFYCAVGAARLHLETIS